MLKKIRITLWVVAALIITYTVYTSDRFKETELDPSNQMVLSGSMTPDVTNNEAPTFMPVAGLKPSGDFTLVDQNNQEFTQDSAAWQVEYKMIYFGFTFCPMICPTELQKMTQVLNDLPSEKADKIQPLFITIDPERDTPDVMKKYISLFHPNFVGLTGTQEQINHMTEKWKIFATRVEDDTLSGYTMDHSSYIYLQGPKGDILGLFRMRDNAADITEYLAKIIP